ncbi:MAG: sortase [Phototrophicales bacterium]|nr:sortase [Phototrophicales bacterium]
MYRRQSSFSGQRLLTLILLGMVGGIAFLIYDSLSIPPSPSVVINTPIPQPTAEVVVANSSPEPTPQSSPIATPTQAPEAVSIIIPSLAINASIIDVYLVDGIWDVSVLGGNVGHLQGTARVGQEGNVVLSGHVELRDGAMGVFGLLNQASIGDRVILREGDRQRQYVITDVYITTPDDLMPVYPTTTSRLTLITCGSYDFFRNQYLERTIVVAEPIG